MSPPSIFRPAFAVLALCACLGAGAGAAHAAGPSASPAPSAAPTTTASTIVDMKNFAFAPAEIVVAAGTAVTFKNSDSVAHTVSAADESFESGDVAPGATWSHVFATPGTYPYVCAYHRYMRGTVVVR